jgi:DNA-binding response OmpR family regulator
MGLALWCSRRPDALIWINEFPTASPPDASKTSILPTTGTIQSSIEDVLHILLAEPDADLRRSLAATLRDADCYVIEAVDVAHAFRVCEETASIGLLIIDQELDASSTGYDLAGKIREQRPIVPLVLLSRPPHSGQVLGLGSNDRLLTIPFGADQLLRIMHELMRTSPTSPHTRLDLSTASADRMHSSSEPEEFGEIRHHFTRLTTSG